MVLLQLYILLVEQPYIQVIVLNDIQGEFSAGETITAPTNSRTGTVQFDAFGCKGFEQKEFNQTKGISMAGSPTYTANVSLDSTFW